MLSISSTIRRLLSRLARYWWVKVTVQNLLGLIPGSLGYRVNQSINNFLQGATKDRDTAGLYRIERSMRNIELLVDKSRRSLIGTRVCEYGTGWRGADPILLYLAGASEINTYDHVQWLEQQSFRNSAQQILTLYSNEPEQFKKINSGVDLLIKKLEKNIKNKQLNLEQLLESCNIRYKILTAQDLALQEDLNGIDVFYTESVLQRIPIKQLRNLLDAVVKKSSDELVMFHRTDQRDIHTLAHVGNNRWGLEYLKYSNWFFNTFISGRFTTQNRLREFEFAELFNSSGMNVVYLERRFCNLDVKKILDYPEIQSKYRDRTDEEIVARASIFVSVKKSLDITLEIVEKEGDVEEIES